METLGERYELGEVLGVGGMARVVAARDRVLDRAVAVKLIREELLDDPTHRRRLLREARGAARLQHPNVVGVHDVSADDDTPFIVMELVEGETLAAVLRREAPLPVERTRQLVDGVLAGLAAAHERGLVHRDVKPANVLLATDGTPKLADFGIARVLEDASTHLTTTGQVMGTPRYLAPELAAGRTPGPAADVYAVGVLAYECLTGRPPFEGDSAIAVALAHQQQAVPPLAGARSGVPPALAAVVERALAKDPAARFADASEMRAALHGGAGEPAPTPTRPLPTPTRPLPAPGVAAPTRPAAAHETEAAHGTSAAPAAAAVHGEDEAGDTGAMPEADATRQLASEPAPGRSRWAVLALVAALAVLVVAVGVALRSDPQDPQDPEVADGQDAPAQGDQDTDEPSDPGTGEGEDADDEAADDTGAADEPAGDTADGDVVDGPAPGAFADLDDLIAALESDPDAAGEKGEDLLDDARAVRDEEDEETRRAEARILVTEIADWLASDELERSVGLDALAVLEPVGRPVEPRLEGASALFVAVASDTPGWGENADDLLSGLEDLQALSAPGRITRDANELADDVETWAAEGALEQARAADAVAILRRVAERS